MCVCVRVHVRVRMCVCVCDDVTTFAPSGECIPVPTLRAHNASELARELEVQLRCRSTALESKEDKLRCHLQIISEMTSDELLRLNVTNNGECVSAAFL